MKNLLVGLIASLALISSSVADELTPGKVFPSISLPSISDGKETAVEAFFGKKMMLHLFASW